MFKKVVRFFHLWLGLFYGIVVFIMGTTGCILVFEKELKQVLYKDRNEVKVLKEKLAVSELKKIAAIEFPSKYPINSVIISQSADRSYIFRSRYKNEDAWTYFGHMEYYHQIYIDPYTGTILKNENGVYEFFHFVTWLHIGLLLSYELGKIITSIAVLIFVILLITGIFLWWPKNKGARKKRFLFKWKATTGKKRKNYDLHSILGIYASSILLIIAVTGLVWSFNWVDSSLQWVANGGEVILPLLKIGR
ncbi:PepSY-associated TM region [Flavobacterium fryxellicola]|uniref:Peptidase n=1 Tax=Flavobacterium fryxellicola TaxID=249352 RepID=A0A167VAA7_9FLAO|nr:PepSY-associated TM helix domain-containing protein [Flavobacterium fryxellicola]OAB26219.1 hypothetical protein FBFR_13355 [Flavobacterium fryxellicola]SHN79614.1 PepSY-associated TM region [Flavobacterium fryxellicola]